MRNPWQCLDAPGSGRDEKDQELGLQWIVEAALGMRIRWLINPSGAIPGKPAFSGALLN